MEKTAVQKLARVLRWCVIIVFVINLLTLTCVPGLASLLAEGGPERVREAFLLAAVPDRGLGIFLPVFLALAVLAVWADQMAAAWTVFFWLCGTCTAVALWQAKKVLDTILEGNPFQMKNARALNRAAVCCWIISGVALARLIWWLAHDHSAAPFFTYNTLFVPAFLMAGLLFQVMSALFRQAAELKEDQDLTI